MSEYRIEGPPQGISKKKRIIRYILLGLSCVVIGFVCVPTEESRRVSKLKSEKKELAKVKEAKRVEKLLKERVYAKQITHPYGYGPALYLVEFKGHEYIYNWDGGLTHTESCEGVH